LIKTKCAYCGKKLLVRNPLILGELEGVVYTLWTNVMTMDLRWKFYHKKCWEKLVEDVKLKEKGQ